jgi:hypothetical protein
MNVGVVLAGGDEREDSTQVHPDIERILAFF